MSVYSWTYQREEGSRSLQRRTSQKLVTRAGETEQHSYKKKLLEDLEFIKPEKRIFETIHDTRLRKSRRLKQFKELF